MKRFRALDIARGVAIAGTLGTNIWIFTMSMEASFLSSLSSTLTNGKFLGLLTIMFGIGMQLKHNHLQKRGLPWYRIYIWAMVILFLDGLLHYIFVFEFDVLMSYAFVGILASFIITRPKKVIITVAILSLSLHLSNQFGWTNFPSVPFNMEDNGFIERTLTREEMNEQIRMEDAIAEGYVMFESDHTTYSEQVKDRLANFWMMRGEAVMIIPMNLALFLFGALLVQSGWVGFDERARRLQKRLLLLSGIIGIPLLIATYWSDALVSYERYIIAPIVSCFYLSVVVYWARTSITPHIQRGFENIGKMALTCYIGQNIIGSILFYNWGFGLAPLAKDWHTVVAWFGIVTFLMIFSTIWLRFFSRGPIELVWKKIESLAYPKQPSPTISQN